jgi:phospholipase C
MGPIMNQSTSAADALTATGACGNGMTALPGVNPATTHAQGRCGYGPRQPLLVISPFARRNFVDHTGTDQTSVIHFIEDNWLESQRIGQGSFDAISNSIITLFDFDRKWDGDKDQDAANGVLFLDPSTGEVVSSNW